MIWYFSISGIISMKTNVTKEASSLRRRLNRPLKTRPRNVLYHSKAIPVSQPDIMSLLGARSSFSASHTLNSINEENNSLTSQIL